MCEVGKISLGSVASCQPEQSIELDFELSNSLTPQETAEETDDSPGSSTTKTQPKKHKLFVPIHETTKK